MPERLEIHTITRTGWQGLADFHVTTIYDRQTGVMVSCAGDTPHESLTNAEAYLAVVNHLKEVHLDVGGEIVAAHDAAEPADNPSF